MTIGCATHTYGVRHRNGGFITSAGDLMEVQYNRILNDVSTAQVVIGVSGPGCCESLGNVRSWATFLDIFRGDQFMWSGPVTGVEWSLGQVTITAVDILGLLDRRVPHQDFSFDGTDLTEIARQLIEDGFAPDDPGHSVTVIDAAGVTGGRAYERNIGQTADHLRDLAKTGLDFTAVGNNIVLLPDDFCAVVGRLTDDDMPEGLTVSEDGAALATRWVVAGSEDSAAVGTAGGADSYYGLLELYDEQTSITSQAAADQAAAARLGAQSVSPIVIDTSNVTLSPDAAVDAAALVPGWNLDITTAATCVEVSQRLKITGLRIEEDGGTGDTPGQEQITVQVTASSCG